MKRKEWALTNAITTLHLIKDGNYQGNLLGQNGKEQKKPPAKEPRGTRGDDRATGVL